MRVTHHTMNALAARRHDDRRLARGPPGRRPCTRPSTPITGGPPGSCPAYDLEWFEGHPISPATGNASYAYAPGACAPTRSVGRTAGRLKRDVNAGGGNSIEQIGVLPAWSVKAFVTQEAGYVREDYANALHWGQFPVRILDPTTGRIPVPVQTAKYYGPAHGYGANRPDAAFGVRTSSDVRMVNPSPAALHRPAPPLP